MLSAEDWRDIELVTNRSGRSGVSSDEMWSPRAELSGAGLLASSDENMESPEQVLRRMKVEAAIDEVDWEYDSRRRSGSASSQSMIFSPILVKQGADIVNVSTSSSAMNVSGGSNERGPDVSSTRATVGTVFSTNESTETLPLDSTNHQGSSGAPMKTALDMWRLGWGSAACSTQFMSWAHEDYYRSFVDDLNKVNNGDLAVIKEERTESVEDEVFDMSQLQ